MPTTPIRRVVISGAPDGTVQVTDGPATAVTELAAVPGTALVDLWRSGAVPLVFDAPDTTSEPFELMPAGAVFRIIDLGPTGEAEPMWHQTDAVDFVYVASGAATVLHDGGGIDLHAGDTIVLRGIRHAWVNRTDSVCRLIDASVAAVPPAG